MVSQFMLVLGLVAGFLNSGIIELVLKLIEQMYQGYTGAEKKALAITALLPLIPKGGKGITSEAIDAQVAAFNEAGVFVHSGAAGAVKVNT